MNGSPPFIIGIDQGTQSTNAVIYDKNGAQVAFASVQVSLKTPRLGWVTQSADELFASVLKCISKAVDQLQVSPGAIAGLAIDSQICSLIAVDRKWNPVGEVLSHLDSRSISQQNEILKNHGKQVLSLNGSLPYIASRLLWLKENAPALFRKISKPLVVNAFIAGKLCGTDITNAFVDYTCMNVYGWGNLPEKHWEDELCKSIGLDPLLSPRIVEPGEIIGSLTSQYSSQCGLSAGTPIIAGAGDAISGWLGAGAIESGLLVDTSGTANHLGICVENFRPDIEEGILSNFPSTIPGLFYMLGFSPGIGRSHSWFIDNFEVSEDNHKPIDRDVIYARLDTLAENVQPGANGLIFIPHFGGRMCPLQPELRGGWLGLTWLHEKRHLYRALLESPAFEYALYVQRARRLYPKADFKRVTVIGGGAKSRLWSQIKANVLNIPFFIPRHTRNFAAFGSAILVGCAVGVWGGIAGAAKKFSLDGEYVYPNPAAHRMYKDLAPRYHRCMDSLVTLYRGIDNLNPSSFCGDS
jgi:xylulokinase